MVRYSTARRDFEYLETLEALEDQVELDAQREECWGGTHVYFVHDRLTRANVTKATGSERRAVIQCARRNADWEKYQLRNCSPTVVPPAKPAPDDFLPLFSGLDIG